MVSNNRNAGGMTKREADLRIAVPRPSSSKQSSAHQPGKPTAQSSHASASSQESKHGNVNGIGNCLIIPQKSSQQLSGEASKFEPETKSTQGPFLRALLHDSTPEDTTLVMVTNNSGSAPVIYQEISPIGTRSEHEGSTFPKIFSTDTGGTFIGSHYVQIQNIQSVEDLNDGIKKTANEWDHTQKLDIFDTKVAMPEHRGTPSAFIAFDDLRDADLLRERTDACKPQWQVNYVTHGEYDQAINSIDNAPSKARFFEGQALFVARPADHSASKNELNIPELAEGLIKLAGQFGEVVAFNDVTQENAGEYHFRLEYYKMTAARRLLNNVNEMDCETVGPFYVIAQPYNHARSSDVDHDNESYYTGTGSQYAGTESRYASTPHLPMPSEVGEIEVSPSGRTAWRYGPDGDIITEMPSKVVPKVVKDHAFGTGFRQEQVYRGGRYPPPVQASNQGFQGHHGHPAQHGYLAPQVFPGPYVHPGPHGYQDPYSHPGPQSFPGSDVCPGPPVCPGRHVCPDRHPYPAPHGYATHHSFPPQHVASSHHGSQGANYTYSGQYSTGASGGPSRRNDTFHRTPMHNIHGRRGSNQRDTGTEPQSINVDTILKGYDVRTTVMLRNIPNWWHWTQLKERLDGVIPNQYDFSYLRIDFQRDMNVSYGFINFIDANLIPPFIKAMHNTEWQKGHRPKRVFECSYATIQGVDCLIEKFRNSAVMDETPIHRPKLWYTALDNVHPAFIGYERPFPGPNNMSKAQRSHDNAGAVGLFPPRSGHRSDRSHRSQWDRGTGHQQQEDAALWGYQNYVAGPPAVHPAATMPPPRSMMQYQPGSGLGEQEVPRAFSAAARHQEGSAGAARGGRAVGGQQNTRR